MTDPKDYFGDGTYVPGLDERIVENAKKLMTKPFTMPRCVCVDPLTSEPDGRKTNFCVGCSGIVSANFRHEYFRNKQLVRERQKTGRNDPCPCGSGRKFKKCCKR